MIYKSYHSDPSFTECVGFMSGIKNGFEVFSWLLRIIMTNRCNINSTSVYKQATLYFDKIPIYKIIHSIERNSCFFVVCSKKSGDLFPLILVLTVAILKSTALDIHSMRE